MTIKAWMDQADRPAPDGICSFEPEGEAFWLRVADRDSVLRDGEPPFEADGGRSVEKPFFFEIATGTSVAATTGAATGGDRRRLEGLPQTFRPPVVT